MALVRRRGGRVASGMRACGGLALFVVLGCSVEEPPEGGLVAAPVVVEVAPVVEAAPVVEVVPVVVEAAPVVAAVVQGAAVPAGGHAVRVRMVHGPEKGEARWTRFELATVDVAGNTAAAATSRPIPGPCVDAPLEAGDLGRWGCGSPHGRSLRLLKDGEGVVLRSRTWNSKRRRPDRWEDEMWLATPASAGVVMHRRPDVAASEDPVTTPNRPSTRAPTADVKVQMVADRGVLWFDWRVIVRVQDGGRLHAMVRSDWLSGKRGPLVPPDPEALASWDLESRGLGGQMRVIEGEGLVALQSRWVGVWVWSDLVRVSLPVGRAAKLVVKR